MRILVNEFCGHAFQMELSRELARRGHQVLHLYFADNLSTPKGDLESNGAAGLSIEGLHVPVAFSKLSLRTRRRADIAYGRAVAAKLDSFHPQVVISANMPLDAQRILLQRSLHHQARFFFWWQDVYSYAVRFVLKRKLNALASLAAAYYQRMEKRLLRYSDGVICIAPGFADLAARWGVEAHRIAVIENWAPLAEVVPTAKDNPWAREQGLNSKFCFMYSGTLGMKHRPELLLELAHRLEERGDAQLVVIAAGAGADWLRAQAATVRPEALKLLPFQPYRRLSEVMGAADVLIALLDVDAGTFSVPSKINSYLCARRPLLLAAPRQNHAATVVERAEAGLVVSPQAGPAFVQAALTLMENPDLRARCANRGRAYAERSYNIDRIADIFLEHLCKPEGRRAVGGVLPAVLRNSDPQPSIGVPGSESNWVRQASEP
jgi:glycosyltransferase involved in cell wall biosynthesis